jgi:carboxymethylenebutenolidase
MGKAIKLLTTDGHELDAYVAEPSKRNGAAAPRAGLVILQEIFGVNQHIRNVTDRFAATGYLSIAPALFDRVRHGIELDYDQAGSKEGVSVRAQIPLEATLADMQAAISWLREQGVARVGVVGYCWGGSLAWWANTRLGVDASVSYYGGLIAGAAQEKNKAPAIFHFGEQDKHIGPDNWATIRAAHPELPLYTYDADHGFNCDARSAYNPAAAKLALERTLAFFSEHLNA